MMPHTVRNPTSTQSRTRVGAYASRDMTHFNVGRAEACGMAIDTTSNTSAKHFAPHCCRDCGNTELLSVLYQGLSCELSGPCVVDKVHLHGRAVAGQSCISSHRRGKTGVSARAIYMSYSQILDSRAGLRVHMGFYIGTQF